MKESETGLVPALEAALRAATTPLDAQALFDMAAIKEHAASSSRVSDYLGNLWRKGLVVRLPAPETGKGKPRWMYEWKGQKGAKYLDAIEYTPKVLADRPSVLITEDGNVITLEFPNLIIQIRQKPAK